MGSCIGYGVESFRFLGGGGAVNKISECLELVRRSETKPDWMLTWGLTLGLTPAS